ncbi:hypothetical protein [Leptospira santarosai]|uniref:hypothetical protein n=1 Tax=Leptospira santarosai TaxID=28183 RepID=UPI00062D0477|nr:hypothetical protein [Leptospira santarosai]AVV79084.1 Uncharacterized protein XB15_01300 [Leptospira santarosai]OLY65399.1 hypothetical protein BWD11_02400 [Leptospira santarosai serovar Grippotyphosa]ONF78220.1 hypothetical protein BWD12_12815 [Leptospira santarosai serovar Bananal]ONF87094.1 hypothetical protein BWD13_07900 [Leptospira santarosai serovar Grippotyphosa]
MQTGIDRRQVILITAGVLVTALVVWCVYLFIFGNSQVSVGIISKTKTDPIGTWRVSPVVPTIHIRFISGSEAVLLEGSSETKLYVLEDAEGLQLRRRGEETPSGYFLFREFKADTWQGLWGDDLVVLRRISTDN